jgi:CO/xanthine dehydrogenase Mo-binding subunit
MQDGTITAREAVSIFDMGAYLGAGPASGISHAVGAYHVPNFRLRSYAVYTNKIWVGSYRASGVADMTFAIESHMDIVARKIGIDPLEFRLNNALEEGDANVNGARVPVNGLKETIRAVGERMGKVDSGGDGNIATGVGVATCEWRSGSGPSTASVSLNEDGTISILTGSVDISGTDTVLAQIGAETLGINVEQVIIAKRDTDLAPYTQPSGGSRIIYSQGKAVQMAAQDTREKVLALAAERLQVSPDALECDGGRVYVQDNPPQGYSLAQVARMSLSSRSGPIMGTGSLSSMPYAPVFNTQGVEVKVDRETGQIRVTRLVQAQDVGTTINPMSVEGQIEGGAVQGIGRALTEDVVIDRNDGHLLNPSFTTYLMPLAADMPQIENILIEVPTEDGPFGARAVAEPPGFGPPAAIANAVYDAIGVRIKDLPITPAKILAALGGEPPEEPELDVASLLE